MTSGTGEIYDLAFNPSELRDERGRWSRGPSLGSALDPLHHLPVHVHEGVVAKMHGTKREALTPAVILRAITDASHHEPDPHHGGQRHRFYGPATTRGHTLRVVVSFSQGRGRVVTAVERPAVPPNAQPLP